METVLNFKNPKNSTNKLFLGEPLGITNFADMKYPIFKRIYKEQLSFIWFPDEISMLKDTADIQSMSEVERFIFEENLSFQTLGDSFLGQGMEGIIKHVTNNELYQSLRVHSFFESSIHTPSYSHAIEGIYNDPAEKFYSILNNPSILKRAEESTEKFNNLLNNSDSDPRLEIVNTIIGLLALESISFYNSFLTSFYFAKNGKMTGVGSIIKLIARDENLHKSNSINVLKILMREESEGFFDLKDLIKERILSSFKEMAFQEFDWIDHLLSRGELPGLTKEGMKRYVKFLANRAVLDVGFTKEDYIFEETSNPYPWVVSFQSSSKSTQVAPQEQEIVNYVKSSKNDLDDMQF
jgi:ribonucleoside-diphosphate reductase beta chain